MNVGKISVGKKLVMIRMEGREKRMVESNQRALYMWMKRSEKF